MTKTKRDCNSNDTTHAIVDPDVVPRLCLAAAEVVDFVTLNTPAAKQGIVELLAALPRSLRYEVRGWSSVSLRLSAVAVPLLPCAASRSDPPTLAPFPITTWSPVWAHHQRKAIDGKQPRRRFTDRVTGHARCVARGRSQAPALHPLIARPLAPSSGALLFPSLVSTIDVPFPLYSFLLCAHNPWRLRVGWLHGLIS